LFETQILHRAELDLRSLTHLSGDSAPSVWPGMRWGMMR
jgi:hypothetical protein